MIETFKIGDLVRFVGTWSVSDGPKTGVVTETWTNGRTRKLTSADVLWDTGKLGNVLVSSLEVVGEGR